VPLLGPNSDFRDSTLRTDKTHLHCLRLPRCCGHSSPQMHNCAVSCPACAGGQITDRSVCWTAADTDSAACCAELRRKTLRSYGLFLISGTSLALHFGCWVREVSPSSVGRMYRNSPQSWDVGRCDTVRAVEVISCLVLCMLCPTVGLVKLLAGLHMQSMHTSLSSGLLWVCDL